LNDEKLALLQIFEASIFWFVLALFFALTEIEVEGSNGWAEKLPTWRHTKTVSARLYGLFVSGKPLTGYHLFLFMIPIMIFHTSFFTGVAWSIPRELVSWSIYFAFGPTWDALWFILNPYYTISNLRKENIWWYNKSFWLLDRIPSDYIICLASSLACGAAASLIESSNSSFLESGYRIILFSIFTLIIIAVSPLYHRWYYEIRQSNEK
jgi:hypothetical protein